MRTRTLIFLLLPVAAVGMSGCDKANDGADSSAQPALQSVLDAEGQPAAAAAAAPLQVDPPGYEMGAVSISGGDVELLYRVRSESTAPITLTRVATSCNCTTAVLEFADGSKEGPFGMAGHELPTELRRTVAPGEEFLVRATYDPAAHGLQGLGKVTRMILLGTEDGSVAKLVFSGEVVVE